MRARERKREKKKEREGEGGKKGKERSSKPVTIIVPSSLPSRLSVLLNKRKIYEDGRKDAKAIPRIELG